MYDLLNNCRWHTQCCTTTLIVTIVLRTYSWVSLWIVSSNSSSEGTYVESLGSLPSLVNVVFGVKLFIFIRFGVDVKGGPIDRLGVDVKDGSKTSSVCVATLDDLGFTSFCFFVCVPGYIEIFFPNIISIFYICI